MEEPWGAWVRKKGWLKDYRQKQKRRVGTRKIAGVSEAGNYAILYPLKCPNSKCRSKNIKCYSTNLPIRYYYCRDCDLRFKVIEAE